MVSQAFRQKTRNRGFTLVEMISVLLIVSILGGVTTYFTVDLALLYSSTQKQTELLQDARRTMRLLTREIISAGEIVDPPRPAIGAPLNTANRIQFERTYRGVNPKDVTFEFDSVDKRITRVADIHMLVPLVDNVTSFVVKRDGYNLIRLEVVFDNGVSKPITLITAVRPRGFPSP